MQKIWDGILRVPRVVWRTARRIARVTGVSWVWRQLARGVSATDWRSVAVWFVGVLTPFVLIVLVIIQLGFWGVLGTGRPADADGLVAAVVTLVGALLAATVTVLGVLAKSSIDKRNQDRLHVDTAIRAIGLLSTPDGKPAPTTQVGGALLALADLDRLDLALALLQQTWPEGDVPLTAAVLVLDRAFTSGDPFLQHRASVVIRMHADLLRPSAGPIMWPDSLAASWNSVKERISRQNNLEALVCALTSHPGIEWSTEELGHIVILFLAIEDHDPAAEICWGAAFALKSLLPMLGRTRFRIEDRVLSKGDIEEIVNSRLEDMDVEVRHTMRALIPPLDDWVKKAIASGQLL